MTIYIAVPDGQVIERDGLAWIMHGDHILGPYELAGAPVGDLLTIDLFARKMLVDVRTVRRWIKRGYIPRVKIGDPSDRGAVRIPSSALVAQYEPQLIEPASPDNVVSPTRIPARLQSRPVAPRT